jgi:flagellar biosynthesis protein FlhG
MSDSVNPFKLSLSRSLRGQEQPTLLVVSGGRYGVGATTVSIGLARAMAQDAQRVVLIDADRQQADLAAACGVDQQAGIDEVLSGRKSIHEALHRGPDGLQILPGAVSPAGLTLSDRAIERLLRQMRTLARHSDAIVVDAGHQATELAARLWHEADQLALVASPAAAAVMDTYALIKRLWRTQAIARPPAVVVSRAAGEDEAADVHRRIDRSCRRFLGVSVAYCGFMPLIAHASVGTAGDALANGFTALARQLVRLPRLPMVPPLAA